MFSPTDKRVTVNAAIIKQSSHIPFDFTAKARIGVGRKADELTGLRKKGQNLEKSKRGDVTCYRIVGAA